MRINPLDNQFLGPNELADLRESVRGKKVESERSDSIQRTLDSYIAKALSTEISDKKEDIAKIRQEMNSGIFDSTEAVRSAAEKILKFGI